MEVLILFMLHLIEYVLQTKQNRRCKFKCFNVITRINESKTLTKYISRKCKCKFDGRKCNSNQKIG